ncbi:YcaO-like family protein [Telmatospirillum sp.]|uniref:YcaO-like family protein n=1 Tax=Telmatospirillum sp. TaxID=2079197 RepID=UPI002840FD50|nr:YcaO-like family protein [Telmatospirillum sp.]MDR3435527.1 YcaO-like family protein [Telmatospirillum sp.]
MSPSVSAPKGYLGGTHRLRSPADTLEVIRPHLAAMGITRVANITGLDRVGVPVVAVYRPNARSVVVSQGKGADLTAARVSGLMEAIESHHAEHPDLPLRLASLGELRCDRPVIDVASLPRLSVSSFHADKPILWCEGRDLTSREPLWVPYEMVHTNYTRPLPSGSGNFLMSSNGLASGNHFLEAACHGLCEVIERDALALWALRGGIGNPTGRLCLDTVDLPSCRVLLDRLFAAELAVGVWDITTDIGLPVFVSTLVDRQGNALGQHYSSHGSGCHPTREVALLRALTEAAQTRLTYIAGTRDDAHRELFETARNPDRVAQVLREIEAPAVVPARSWDDVADYQADNFDDDLAFILDRLRAVGVTQAAALEFPVRIPGISVVRIIVPGLEGLHDAPGYVPGRRAEARLRGRQP